MIDTIVLILTPEMFQLTKPNLFEPSAHWVFSKQFKGRIRSIQNPHKRELAEGIYKPRLTLSNRFSKDGMQASLKIELSLPKLFFGNNFQELRYKDFDQVNNKLVHILSDMGIETTKEIISQAPVSGIHYSKNIPLRDGTTPYQYINKIKEAHIERYLDTNQTDYRNEGHSYRWHCNSYEVVFYDKIYDLAQAKKSSKRSIEQDSIVQLNLFDRLRKRKKFEVLRMEVRLNKRSKIKSLFAKLGIKSKLTFKKLFKPATAKKVLLHYIEKLGHKRPLLLDYRSSNDAALLAELIVHNPTMSPKKILSLFGLKKALEKMQARELQRMFGASKNIHKIIKEANGICLPSASNPFALIKKNLEKFKALKYK